MKVNSSIKSLGAALTVVMVLGMGDTVLASSPAPTPAPAGDQDYVSMHNYMSKTDVPGVYKVTLNLQTPAVATGREPVYVAITLDASGSMMEPDIWDSTGNYTSGRGPGAIQRYKAMEAAVEATIDSLIADGNKQIYINLSTHDGNSYDDWDAGSPGTPSGMPELLDDIKEASQFVSLYKADGTLRPEFDKSLPSWIMNDWDGWAHGDIAPRTPGNLNGWGGHWNSNDFALAFERIHGFFRDGLVSGNIPADAVRYVLAMGDGDDWGGPGFEAKPTVARSTMEWSTALKAPLDANYKNPGGSTTEAKTVMGAAGGMDAVIWGVTVGSDTSNLTTWAADLLTMNGALPAWETTWRGTVGPFRFAQPRMIANTMTIPEAKIADGSIYYPNTTLKVWSNSIIDDYVTWWNAAGMTIDNSATGNTHYTHSEFLKETPNQIEYAGTSLMDAFSDFGTAAAQAAGSVHTGLESTIQIDNAYELYAYPGKPMVELTSTDPTAVQSATVSGRTIKWDIDKLESASYLTMVFYVKMDEGLNPDYYYPLFDKAYLTYIPSGETDSVTKQFPIPYAKPGGETRDGVGGGYGGGLPSDPNGIPVNGNGTPINTGSSASKPSTGAEGHQENRELAGNGGWGGASDIAPNVTEIKGSTDSSGRSRVEVSLTNGNQMRYQWQFKNAAGEWEDIFGATGSHYTLGKQFAAGQEYEFRTKITNPAGRMSFTEIVKLTVEAGSGSGLQVQEEGPSIDSESLMDAGEEITVANTASNGQILSVIAGIVVIALAAVAIVGYRRRKAVEEE